MLTKFRPPDLAAQNGRIDEIRMIPNVVKHPNRNSPPKLGGVAARSIKSREATLFRADGVVLGLGTTPARLMKRRRATPPNLGGEFLFGCFALVHPEFPQIRSSELLSPLFQFVFLDLIQKRLVGDAQHLCRLSL